MSTALATRSVLCVLAATTIATPSAAQTEITREAAEAVVDRLDRAFDRREVDAYLAIFQPLHRRLHDRLEHRLRAVLAEPAGLVRSSKIVDFRPCGARAVVILQSRIEARDADGLDPVKLASVLVVGSNGTESFGLFEVEFQTGEDAVLSSSEFDCAACNYQIAVPADWLLVPHCRSQAGCLESLSFYSLSKDLAIDLSVHVAAEDPGPAADQLRGMIESEGGELLADIVEWLPPYYDGPRAAAAPPALRGARCEVGPEVGDKVGDQDDRDRSLLFLASYGRVRYLMAARADADTLAGARAEIDQLLAGFRLIDPDLDPAEMADRPYDGHVAGQVEGRVFRHPRSRIEFRGPVDWRVSCPAGQYLFEVAYHCPYDRGQIRVMGLAPGAGATRWTRTAADQMLQHTLARAGLRALDEATWVDNSEVGRLASVRTIRARRAGDPDEDFPHYLLRFSMDDDLLVVIEGVGNDEIGMRAVQEALDELKRAR